MKNSARTLILAVIALAFAVIVFVIFKSAGTSNSTPINSLPLTIQVPRDTATPPILPLPSGTPITDWNGIPVMPGAVTGNGNNEGYSYTVQALPQDVQKFYENEMKNLGWEMFTNGQSTTKTILLLFTKDQDAATVSISLQPDGLTYVLLVK